MDCDSGGSGFGCAPDHTMPVHVVSLASDSDYAEQITTLKEWGYRLVNNPPLDPDTSTVVLIDTEHVNVDRLQATLHRLAPVWPLAVLLGPVDGQLTLLLAECADFVHWPCPPEELALRLDRIQKLRRQPHKPVTEDDDLIGFLDLNLVGQSPSFTAVLSTVKRIAPRDVPVSVYGETGTGKELIAQALHYLGPKADGPFIPINCGSLPDSLLENELFGHAKGAYTDATSEHQGLIAQAEGGTLFLDEIETLTPHAQVTLLRFLQDRQYRSLGGKNLLTANVRIVVASNVSLAELKENGSFRPDLFFRLNLLPINLPPLRDREGDIPLLAEHFIRILRHCYESPSKFLHAATLRWLQMQDWPGNVRELEHTIHRAFLLAEDDCLHPHHCQAGGGSLNSCVPVKKAETLHQLPFNVAKARVISDFEHEYLEWLLAETEGNLGSAAELAGKDRRVLSRLLKKNHIDRRDFVPR